MFDFTGKDKLITDIDTKRKKTINMLIMLHIHAFMVVRPLSFYFLDYGFANSIFVQNGILKKICFYQ